MLRLHDGAKKSITLKNNKLKRKTGKLAVLKYCNKVGENVKNQSPSSGVPFR